MIKNWKTTSSGITLIISSLLGFYLAYKNNHLDEGTISAAMTGLLGGIGLIFAHDAGNTIPVQPSTANLDGPGLPPGPGDLATDQ